MPRLDGHAERCMFLQLRDLRHEPGPPDKIFVPKVGNEPRITFPDLGKEITNLGRDARGPSCGRRDPPQNPPLCGPLGIVPLA